MADLERIPSLGERMTRLEALFEANLAYQARREEEDSHRRREHRKEQRRREALAVREWRELAACVQSVAVRLDKFEPVILGDGALGQKSLGERLETLEGVLLSARIGWRAATVIATGLAAIASAVGYALR